MASENLAKLQAQINRFASTVKFSPLVIDGGMGPKTEEALVRTLQFIEGGCKGACAGPQTMAAAAQGLVNADTQTGIMQNLAELTQLLTGVAEVLSLGSAATVALNPTASPATFTNPTTPNKAGFIVGAPPGMGVFDKARLWARQQPLHTQAGLGIGGGIILLITLSAIAKKRKAA